MRKANEGKDPDEEHISIMQEAFRSVNEGNKLIDRFANKGVEQTSLRSFELPGSQKLQASLKLRPDKRVGPT